MLRSFAFMSLLPAVPLAGPRTPPWGQGRVGPVGLQTPGNRVRSPAGGLPVTKEIAVISLASFSGCVLPSSIGSSLYPNTIPCVVPRVWCDGSLRGCRPSTWTGTQPSDARPGARSAWCIDDLGVGCLGGDLLWLCAGPPQLAPRYTRAQFPVWCHVCVV